MISTKTTDADRMKLVLNRLASGDKAETSVTISFGDRFRELTLKMEIPLDLLKELITAKLNERKREIAAAKREKAAKLLLEADQMEKELNG